MLCSILLLFSTPNSYSFIYLHGRTGWCCFLQWIASHCLIFKDLLLEWSVLGHGFGWMVVASFSILVMSIRHWASNFILMFISQRTAFSGWGVEKRRSVAAEPICCLPCLCWYSLWRWRARRHMLSIISFSKSSSISASKSLRIRCSSVEIVFAGTAPCSKKKSETVHTMHHLTLLLVFYYLQESSTQPLILFCDLSMLYMLCRSISVVITAWKLKNMHDKEKSMLPKHRNQTSRG